MINPTSRVFLIVTLIVFLGAIVCFVQGELYGGIVCTVFGALGLVARFNATKK